MIRMTSCTKKSIMQNTVCHDTQRPSAAQILTTFAITLHSAIPNVLNLLTAYLHRKDEGGTTQSYNYVMRLRL